MTGAEFKQWLTDEHKCEFESFERARGFSLRVFHPKTKKFAWFGGPYDDRTLSNREIKDVCDQLLIDYPQGIV